MRLIDITGKRFGRWTVLAIHPERLRYGRARKAVSVLGFAAASEQQVLPLLRRTRHHPLYRLADFRKLLRRYWRRTARQVARSHRRQWQLRARQLSLGNGL